MKTLTECRLLDFDEIFLTQNTRASIAFTCGAPVDASGPGSANWLRLFSYSKRRGDFPISEEATNTRPVIEAISARLNREITVYCENTHLLGAQTTEIKHE